MTTLLPSLRFNSLINRPRKDLYYDFFEGFNFPNIFKEEDNNWMPKIDVSETEKEYRIKSEVPGIDKKDINITLTDGILTIKGEKKHEKEEKEENYHIMESSYGSFSRTLKIPTEVDSEKIDASYNNGVLRINIPKAEAVKPKKVEIN